MKDIKLDVHNPMIARMLSGGVKENPDFNPRKKKNPEPRYISDMGRKPITGGVWDDMSAGAQKMYYDNNTLGLSLNEFNSYADYGALPGPYKTQKELDRVRADNQSGLEQVGNFVVQGLGNEVILGTALGLSNLIDAAVNLSNTLGITNGANDYTNPVSTLLEGYREDIRNKFEIYNREPGETFQFSDFGWWMNGSVSALSTLSMLIPSMGVTKAASALGRIGKAAGQIGRFEQGIYNLAKVAEKGGKIKNPATLAKAINQGTNIGSSAIMSRTMEGYMEARETYNEVKKDALNKLENLKPDELKRFLEVNPDMVNMSNEERASLMAGISADQTFRQGYALTLLDAMQFKAIPSLWKPSSSVAASTKLTRLNKIAALELAGKTAEAAQLNTIKSRFMSKLSNIRTKPLTALGSIELSEGLEEGYQTIISEASKAKMEKAFDPNYNENQLSDYLTDSHVWESAFWGVFGGLTFKGGATLLGNTSNRVKNMLNKKNLSEEEYALRSMGQEKQRLAEINGRGEMIKEFRDKMQVLSQGYNPNEFMIDPVTGEKIIEDGNEVMKSISKEDADNLKASLVNEFVTNMTINAIESGNLDLLKDFVGDAELDRLFKEAGVNIDFNDSSLENAIKNKIGEVGEVYQKSLYDIMSSVNVEDENVAKIVARNITRNKLYGTELSEILSNINRAIAADPDTNTITPEYRDKLVNDMIEEALKEFDEEQNNLKERYEGKNPKLLGLSKQAYEEAIENLNNRRREVLEFSRNNTGFGQVDLSSITSNIPGSSPANVNAFLASFNKFLADSREPTKAKVTIPKRELQELEGKRIRTEFQIERVQDLSPSSQADYERLYKETFNNVNRGALIELNNAFERVSKYIENSGNPEDARARILRDEVPELQNDLDKLKLGSANTVQYLQLIDAVAGTIRNDLDEQAKKDAEIKNGKEVVDEEKAAIDKEDIDSSLEKARTDNEQQVEEQVEQPIDEQASQRALEIVTPLIDNTSSTGGNTEQSTSNRTSAEIPVGGQVQEIIPTSSITDASIGGRTDLSNDDLASSYATRIVFALFKTNRPVFETLAENGIEDPVFDTIIDAVERDLLDMGTSRDVARPAAIQGLKLALNVINRTLNNTSQNESDSKANRFKDLADQVATMQKISKDNNRNLLTNPIQESEETELFDALLDAYIDLNNIVRYPGVKSIININDFFDYLISNPDIGYEQAKHIFYNIINHIENSDKFLFSNKSSVLKNKNSPADFFRDLIEAKTTRDNLSNSMHVSTPSITSRSPNYMAYTNMAVSGEPVYVVINGNSISFRMNRNSKDSEIGYITTVESVGNTGNSFKLSGSRKGFVYHVTNENGVIVSNFDELIESIIDYETGNDIDKDLFDILKKVALHKPVLGENKKNRSLDTNLLTDEETKFVLEHPMISNLIETNQIRFPNNAITDHQKARYIANNLSDIVFFSGLQSDAISMKISYNNWLNNVFDNYSNTFKIQEAVANDPVNDGNLQVKFSGTSNPKVLRTDTPHNINTPKLGFTKENTVVAVDANGNIVGESGNNSFSNRGNLVPGSMGMVIGENKNGPIIALFEKGNNIKGTEIGNLVEQELNNIFRAYRDGQLSYNELRDLLSDLMGGPGTKNGNLFSGYNVLSSQNGIALNVNGSKRAYTVTIGMNVDSNGVGVNEIYYSKDSNNSFVGPTLSDTLIKDMVDTIVSNLEFNRTFFPILNKNVDNNTQNAYMQKRDGTFVVSIGSKLETNQNGDTHLVRDNSKERVYSNFGEFALVNGAFTTRQDSNNRSGVDKFFETSDEFDSLYLNIDSITGVEDIIDRSIESGLKDLIKHSGRRNKDGRPKVRTMNEAIPIVSLLRAANIPLAEANFLTGQNAANIALVPNNVFYNSQGGNARAYYSRGKIYFTPNGVNHLTGNTSDIKRLLIHENLHLHFDNLTDERKAEIISELANIYNEFVDSLNSAPDTVVNRNIKQWFDESLSVDSYLNLHYNSLNARAKRRFDELTQDQKVLEILPILMEEFFVESFSNRVLTNYLNNTQSSVLANVSNIEEGNKSLLQRIFEMLMKLFNLGNINDSSLLARQYVVFSNIAETSKVSSEKIEVDKQNKQEANEPGNSTLEKETIDEVIPPVEEVLQPNVDTIASIPEIDSSIETQANTDDSDVSGDIDTTQTGENEDFDDGLNKDKPTRKNRRRLNSLSDAISDGTTIDEIKTNAYVSNSNINPYGIALINNMDDFVNQFSIDKRASVASQVSRNELNFICNT